MASQTSLRPCQRWEDQTEITREIFTVENGLILRTDMHTLFDLRLISVDPNGFRIVIHPGLKNTNYEKYNRKQLLFPVGCNIKPSIDLIEYHFNLFNVKAEDEIDMSIADDKI